MTKNKRIIGYIPDTQPGDTITARHQTAVARQVNANTQGIARPRQKDLPAGSTGEESSANVNKIFAAGATDITSTTVTLTTSDSATVDVERIDEIVFTETTTGETMTLQITYV